MDELKFYKELKIFGVFLIIIQTILLIANILSNNLLKIYSIIGALIALILIILFWFLTYNKNIAGPIVGIVLGAMYIISLDWASIVIGIGLIIDCARFIKYITNQKN